MSTEAMRVQKHLKETNCYLTVYIIMTSSEQHGTKIGGTTLGKEYTKLSLYINDTYHCASRKPKIINKCSLMCELGQVNLAELHFFSSIN